MRIADSCRRQVVTATANATLAEVARLMRNQHVGTVVIVEGRKPMGIVALDDMEAQRRKPAA